MKRKISTVLALVLMLSTLFNVNAFASDVSVYVDNEYTYLTDADGNTVYPFIQNGTTYIPVRGISQALDCTVEWDGNSRNVMIYKDSAPDGKVFRNNSNDVKLYVDNEEQKLYDANGTEVKPFIKDGTTYVPLRGVSKVLGYYIEWEGQTKSVYVWKDKVSPNGVTMDFLRPYKLDAPIGGMDILYESDGEIIQFDNNSKYTNTIHGAFGSAFFNLDGKYDTLTCVLGFIPKSYGKSSVSFIVDGKIVESFDVTPESFSKEVTINLNKGLQLEIAFNAGKTMTDGNVALGNITFYGE